MWASRSAYAEFLRAMDVHCRATCFGPADSKGEPALLPVYTVGSWNEEFEGHALFPARYNRSMKRLRYGGFDIPLALKEVFGWNTYSRRRIDLSA